MERATTAAAPSTQQVPAQQIIPNEINAHPDM